MPAIAGMARSYVKLVPHQLDLNNYSFLEIPCHVGRKYS